MGANERHVPNIVQTSLLSAFPNIEEIFREKVNDGLKVVSFSYEADVSNDQDETITIVFTKGYERYVLTQSRNRMGGFSLPVFRKE